MTNGEVLCVLWTWLFRIISFFIYIYGIFYASIRLFKCFYTETVTQHPHSSSSIFSMYLLIFDFLTFYFYLSTFIVTNRSLHNSSDRRWHFIILNAIFSLSPGLGSVHSNPVSGVSRSQSPSLVWSLLISGQSLKVSNQSMVKERWALNSDRSTDFITLCEYILSVWGSTSSREG